MRLPNPFRTKSISEMTSQLSSRRGTILSSLSLGDSKLGNLTGWAEEALVNRLFYDGDHWQGADGWIGPLPPENERVSSGMIDEIMRVFCSRNVIKEVVDRKVDGLLKRRPRMMFTPKNHSDEDEESSDTLEDVLQEANDLFKGWAEKRSLLSVLKELYGRSQLGERPVLRIYVPPGRLEYFGDGSSMVPVGTIEESLDRIHLQVLHSGVAGEVIDPDTQLSAVVCQLKTPTMSYNEVVFVDEDMTVIRTIGSNVPQNDLGIVSLDESSWELMLGKRLTMREPRLKPCITQQIRENQRAINLAKTMMTRNTITGGFLERIILDAMPPGHWEKNPNAAEGEDEEVYVVEPFKVGAGTTNFFMAAEHRDDMTGEKKFGNPTVYFRDPVSSQTFIDQIRACYQDILEEVGQPHVLIAGYATTSGTSREQSREIFQGTLNDDEGELNSLMVWLMETVMSLAAAFSNQIGRYDEIRAEAECYLTVGPMSGSDRQDTRENVRAGLLSRRTAMSRDGVEDPDAELSMIKCERRYDLESLQMRATLYQTLVGLGMPPTVAAELVDLEIDEIDEPGEPEDQPEADDESEADDQSVTDSEDGTEENADAA